MINPPKGSTVGLVVPTLNAGPRWQECLEAVKGQSIRPQRLLVVDSASTDDTPVLARAAGFEVVPIKRSEFNHGGTRQWAANHLAECGVIVFMTQDAIPASEAALERIVSCFSDPTVAVAYGRQLPHKGATPIEAHARLFNYGEQSVKKDPKTVERLGAKVFFCSNSFAAYRSSVLFSLGGFKHDLILGEDMEFAARAVKAGFANMYCAEAAVYHSHDYSVNQTIERYFDLGVFERRNGWMRKQFGSHQGEGMRFISSELRFLAEKAPWQIPRALFLTAAKLIGYRLGLVERILPGAVKRKLSMSPGYFHSINAESADRR